MNETTTTEERYTSATKSSNLRVKADKHGDADVIIAAGWSSSRIGMALLRLHSEWDGIQHPRKMTDKAIAAYALTLKGDPKDRYEKAHRIAQDWYVHEVKLMLSRLKSLSSVREQLLIHAVKWQIDSDVVINVLVHWLDPICNVCHGQERQQIRDTPILSDVVCPACCGSGKSTLPGGRNGREVDRFISDCLDQARYGIKKRLREF